MKLKKLTHLFLTIFAVAGASLFFAGCDDNNMEDAADEVGDAVEEAGEATKDAVEDGADAVKDATN